MKTEKAEKLFQMIGEIDEDIIAEAEEIPKPVANITHFPARKSYKALGILVASIAFVTISIIGISGMFGFDGDGGDFAASDNVAEEAAPAPDAELGIWDVVDDSEDVADESDNHFDYRGRYEEITLEVAYLIPTLGHYLPRFIPDDFNVEYVRRSTQPEEKLSLAISSDDAHIDWVISLDTSSNDEIILLSEMTFEILVQVAEYLETGWNIALDITDLDVLIQINMYGIKPQDAWEIIQSIKN